MRARLAIAALLSAALIVERARADQVWVYRDGRPAGVTAHSLNRLEAAKSECELAMRMSALSGPLGCDGEFDCRRKADQRWQQAQADGLACMAKKGYRLKIK